MKHTYILYLKLRICLYRFSSLSHFKYVDFEVEVYKEECVYIYIKFTGLVLCNPGICGVCLKLRIAQTSLCPLCKGPCPPLPEISDSTENIYVYHHLAHKIYLS
jgi:hypothetical protein